MQHINKLSQIMLHSFQFRKLHQHIKSVPQISEKAKNLLKDFPVVISIPVQWGELDAFGHLNNVVYLRYLESARIDYLGLLKSNFLPNGIPTGVGPIVKSVFINYKVPIFYPDTLFVGARTRNLQEDRFTMEQLVVSQNLGKVAAEGHAVVVAYDFSAHKKAKVPADIVKHIQELENNQANLPISTKQNS